jgi:hypothetical protein
VRGLALAVALAGCQPLADPPRPLAPLDQAYFDCRVQPVLGTSCAAFACHGDGRRFFRVFARNRLRWGGDEAARNARLTDGERAANFDAARSFVDAGAPGASLLLLKPLEAGAGGYYHRGAEIYGGGNVFRDQTDPDWKTLAAWIGGATEDPGCTEPGSDQ